MRLRKYTPLISSRLVTTWISRPCELSATNPLQHPLCTLSPSLLTRQNYLPKSSLRPTRTFSMCSHEKRLRTCPLIASLIMKFTLRMTRHLLIATSTHSLEQSSVSCANSLTTCSARGSSDHHNHQVVHPSSLLRKRMAPCDSVWTSETSTRSLGRINTRSHLLPTSSTNWAAQRSTPS